MISAAEILAAKILIVDDQEANVKLLEHVLSEAGYTHVSATLEPRDVLTLHRINRFDLILLDLQMPTMDGFEVMAQLQANEPMRYLPVIVLTAQPGHKLRALQAGAKDFVSKPFDLLEVKTRIHNMLEVRLLYQRLERHNETLERTVLERTAQLRESEYRFRRLTELASDWYWEQNALGEFTHASGPVQEMLGLRMASFLSGSDDTGWNEAERSALRAKVDAREAFLDFEFSRQNGDGSQQRFRVSGEPMFDAMCSFNGYRGIGVEIVLPKGLPAAGTSRDEPT
jgi:CheY-like chemotaxis protein